MSSKKTIKSAFESMMFTWGEPLEAKVAAEVFNISRQEAVEYFEELKEEYEQEGRGIGLMNKIAAYKLQEEGLDTVEANIHLGFKPDERDYGCGAQILRKLGVQKMKLLTNNPVKRVGLEAYGLQIVENIPIEVTPNMYNIRYLKTKKTRMGHTLHI